MRYEDAYEAFLTDHPAYRETLSLDALRASGYARLDALGHTYLDYTGGGLYADSQLAAHRELLAGGVFGNPHSHNPTSLASTSLVEEARAEVLAFFNAPAEEYDVVFTANASGALKHVGESYPFGPSGRFLVSYDNHNSVNGIREYARRGGADVVYAPVRNPELRLDAGVVERHLARRPSAPSLFAFPAQSNFSGVQHPLGWIGLARRQGWDVLLDAAAFVPTNRLDLTAVKPDFVPVSFYKMFGYPTGIGALIARHEALAKLRRPWFAGGTITLASVQDGGRYHLAEGHAGFEDGTVDYLGLPAVTIGLRHLASAGIDAVHTRVTELADWLLAEMRTLAHPDGAPLVRVFGPAAMDRRGSTIAFYLLDPAGRPYDVYEVERLAGEDLISVRTGCFCNPGDGEVAHGISAEEMAECFEEMPTLADCQRLIADASGKTPNTIRVSLGIASDFRDVWRFREFMLRFRGITAEAVAGGALPPR